MTGALLDSRICLHRRAGTGFADHGTDKGQIVLRVDEDAHAFAEFITAFLSKYKRWNSPKYLFGRKLWHNPRGGSG